MQHNFFVYNTNMKLIEAVPNISEGQDETTIRALADCLRSLADIQLLGTDANPSANRTVFTVIGKPKAVCKALFDFVSLATERIDMRAHHGAHPRIGAVDVCPLIPLREISLSETAKLAQQLASHVGKDLQIPIYLYEASALRAACKNLADIRRGEYENLAEKLRTLPPDFGPTEWNERVQKTGACVMGARNFLVAFNINLDTNDASVAKQIAARLRQSGGGLLGVKAIGWYMENFKRAQVSCNIVDFRVASLPLVFETCQKEAAALGVRATGCELVGLVPLEAVLTAGRHYKPSEKDPHTLIDAAIKGLNLCEVKPFSPAEQILEIKAGLAH